MNFYADLHIHSKYSRATSKTSDLPNLVQWAKLKGLRVLGTGDFTHPAWRSEIEQQLQEAEPGLFRLRPEIEQELNSRLPDVCNGDVRFCLTVEISTIYKKGEKTRKVHHVVLMPDMESAKRFVDKLEKVGNLHSDGRPILGLDSRDLLEMVLESGDGAYLIPAHIWTPWFAMLGSKSGFDSVEECYGDLSEHIFALETGLSSDPAMNWQVSALDKYRLVSNSDAHSPSKLAREACIFDCEPNYFSMMEALHSGDGYVGTVEFFPEEGKYHFDGHRKCEVCSSPEQTRSLDGKCPACGKPLTLGVLYRVEQLADRSMEQATRNPPLNAGEVRSLVPLSEVLSEILGVGSTSKTVQRSYRGLLERLGPELDILWRVDLENIKTAASELLAVALERLRAGRVISQPGFDGEYGAIRLFDKGELEQDRRMAFSFYSNKVEKVKKRQSKAQTHDGGKDQSIDPVQAASTCLSEKAIHEQDIALDPEQRLAVEHEANVLLVQAGPGSGKTRVLTHRIAYLVSGGMVRAKNCLAIAFTNRAAEEIADRLRQLLPEKGQFVQVMTLHALGLEILRAHHGEAGLRQDFCVGDEGVRLELLMERWEIKEREARKQLAMVSKLKRSSVTLSSEDERILERYERTMRDHHMIDFDDLIVMAADVLAANPDLADGLRSNHEYIFVDELQDLNPGQERLLSLLTGPRAKLTAIGDADQSIYGFTGVVPGIFGRLAEAYPGSVLLRLKRNYRSARAIVSGATGVMKNSDGKERALEAIITGTHLIGTHEATTDKAEAEFIVHTLEQLIGGHSFFSLDSGRSTDGAEPELGFGDIAVLYRTEAQSLPIVEALERSGFPYQVFSHDSLMDKPAVRAIARDLRNKPGTGNIFRRIKRRLAAIKKENEELSGAQLKDAVDLLAKIAKRCGEDRGQFLTELVLNSQSDAFDPRSERISLMTIHASKGLEFPVVFLTGCEDGLLPLRFGHKLASDMDEERRLFYVGMTRAMRRLILTRAKRRTLRGAMLKLPPSPFLLDVERELLAQMQKNPSKRPKRKKEQLGLF